jgi:mono/diheme cytochrome c family protein
MKRVRKLTACGLAIGLCLFMRFAVTPGHAAPAHSARGLSSAQIPASFTAKPTPQRLARGRYLVTTVAGCFDCHSPHEYVNKQWIARKGLEGAGQIFPPHMLPLPPHSLVVAPNITPDRATGIGSWTDAEIARAIADGVDNAGHPLFSLMPYASFHALTTEDLKSIIVYLRSLPPVDRALPATHIPFPIHVELNPPTAIPSPVHASAAVRHGWYLTRMAGCADCHTPILANGTRPTSMLFAGGMHFQGPFGNVFSLNITPDSSGISFMDEKMFARTLRTGRVNGTGLRLNPIMPFIDFRNLRSADLRDIYLYLRTVPKVRHEIDNTDPPTYCPLDGEMHGLGDLNKVPAKKGSR